MFLPKNHILDLKGIYARINIEERHRHAASGVLSPGERPRELDDDVSGRGIAGVGGSVHTGEHIVHTSPVFLSTSLEADGIRERIAAAAAAGGAPRRPARPRSIRLSRPPKP